MPTIRYTQTDEAPALATASFLPIIKAFTKPAGIEMEARDISLAGRILAVFPEFLSENQRVVNDLEFLGKLAKEPDANIIKLPNISASIPQLKEAISELQEKGFPLPEYPDDPRTDKEKDIRARYDRVKGSAVNPVLREGNSDRRAPKPVKSYARKHPHSMGAWTADSRSRVATMSGGDFKSNEKSVTLGENRNLRIEWRNPSGEHKVLKAEVEVSKGAIIDASLMEKEALIDFLADQISAARAEGILFSVHLKATMMKVSDPIIFGHVLQTYFKTLFETYGPTLDKLGVNANEGLESLLEALQGLPEAEALAIRNTLSQTMEQGPSLAMVNSDKGITNLHVPSDIIIDASMPAMIRNSGQMWDSEGNPQDTLAVIPDSSYAGIYDATINFCKQYGALDPKTMGSVPNVGLMAQKAEEYGSHDKTFEIKAEGIVQVIDNTSGEILLEHNVKQGDIWRMCTVTDAAVQNWVELAVRRVEESGTPAVFWLDSERAHDRELIKKVDAYLPESTRERLDIRILSPEKAAWYTLERIREGKDTISVTGNVLRDYLTDLFPILEVGTSAKMLSIVPLMNGGGLFETGAGGSAPKHVEQFVEEGHLRWDSLGEFMALAVSLDHCSRKYKNTRAGILSETLDLATEKFLEENKSPSRKVGELDTRGSHFFLALYWAQALAAQNEDEVLKRYFQQTAQELTRDTDTIVNELLDAQGRPQDIGGYFLPHPEKKEAAMRPSPALNTIIERLLQS
ncbi:NADP-dependent isocitrate dehydrogenase [Robiginitalea aurantiaca]|uniref:Isocitrate dehydrogenase [NADP] n=1 Tax=Robiginitalea aurantiaca TaxID=3056915 RepID=A0ABT7WI94_9FLAO|nr:NADP-dependent isocitrate dehydrogenase [Robiginitalea aurantiaca]MDM9632632.1 NADP-dependent isocitrate dehydrogenase [Robiginitalea aurantiaca]